MELCEQTMHVLESTTIIKLEPEIISQPITSVPKAPHKRKMLTVAEKVEIINAIKNGASNASICKQKQLTSSSVSSIWKNRETLVAAFECNKAKAKRLRLCDKSDLEELLATWVRDQIKHNVIITRPTIKEKATEFAEKLGYTNYKCHNSWLDRFKVRNNITYGKIKERKNCKDLSKILLNEDNCKINTNEQWINNNLKNDELININIKVEQNENLTQSTFEEKVMTNEEVQSALHTLNLFYKTNYVSSEFQNHLSQIKRIVDNHFFKKE